MTDKTYIDLLHQDFLLFKKSGIIETVRPPEYGEISLYYANGQLTHYKKSETIK